MCVYVLVQICENCDEKELVKIETGEGNYWCVCMCPHLRAFVCVCAYACIHARMYVCILYTCMYVFMYLSIRLYTRTHTGHVRNSRSSSEDKAAAIFFPVGIPTHVHLKQPFIHHYYDHHPHSLLFQVQFVTKQDNSRSAYREHESKNKEII